MDDKTASLIFYDHRIMGSSYRILAEKYGVSRTSIHRVVMSKQYKRKKPTAAKVIIADSVITDDITLLQDELRKARLKIALQDLMLDISSKELGIDLRKKHGTRRSK